MIEWQRLRDGAGTFAEYRAFLDTHPDWPGLPLLRRKGEAKAKAAEAAAVVAFFAALPPQTGEGSLAYAAALAAQGRSEAAAKEAVRAWRGLSLTAEEHAAFLDRYGTLLADHHDGRVAAMLRAGLTADVRRMLPLASAYTRSVAAARIALQDDSNGVG